MDIHERKRELWFPEDLLGPARTSARGLTWPSCKSKPQVFQTLLGQPWR